MNKNSKKEQLFLDACWLNDAYGRRHLSKARFERIMKAVQQKYDLIITDRVYEEVTTGSHIYKKNSDLKKWIDSNDNIRLIATNTPPGKDAGEKSIIELIENKAEFSNAKIASHDEKFFNSNNVLATNHINRIVRLNHLLPKLVKEGILDISAYYSLANSGNPSLKGGWDRSIEAEYKNKNNHRNRFKNL